jgi:hypothetical protein
VSAVGEYRFSATTFNRHGQLGATVRSNWIQTNCSSIDRQQLSSPTQIHIDSSIVNARPAGRLQWQFDNNLDDYCHSCNYNIAWMHNSIDAIPNIRNFELVSDI